MRRTEVKTVEKKLGGKISTLMKKSKKEDDRQIRWIKFLGVENGGRRIKTGESNYLGSCDEYLKGGEVI